jgi:Tfp pilus assembly protein FimT
MQVCLLTRRARRGGRSRAVLSSAQGFSITELLLVCAIAAVLTALAAPALRGALDSQRLRSASDGLSTLLLEARRDAIRSNRANTVALDLDARSIAVDGVINGAGTLVPRRFVVLPAGVDFDGNDNPPAVTFDPLGRPTLLPATFRLVSIQSGQVRIVQVLATGRIQVL